MSVVVVLSPPVLGVWSGLVWPSVRSRYFVRLRAGAVVFSCLCLATTGDLVGPARPALPASWPYVCLIAAMR